MHSRYFNPPSQIYDPSQGIIKISAYSESQDRRDILENYNMNIKGKEQIVETVREEADRIDREIQEWKIKMAENSSPNIQPRERQQHNISLKQEMPLEKIEITQNRRETSRIKEISDKIVTTQKRQITQVSQYSSIYNQQPSTKKLKKLDNFEQLTMLKQSSNLSNAATTNLLSQRPKPTFPQMSTQNSLYMTQNSNSIANSSGVKKNRKQKSSNYIYLEGDDYLEYKNVLVVHISRNPINNIIEISRTDNQCFQENVIANLEDELEVGKRYTFKMKLAMEYMDLRFYLLSKFN